MRNLKRALSLTLASVMLLGMMVVGAGAAGYPDVNEDDHNIEAIEVLQAVKVMQGNEQGNFDPDSPVNRSQMAVVMANLLNLDYNYYEGTCPFWDVPDWAKPYVAACYANGIVSGYNATTYGAADSVTAVQAASMMMRALGYFQYQEDYDQNGGFELATVKQANAIGLFDGLGANATAALTRNQVAKLALNALEANMVNFTGTPGTQIDLGDGKKVSMGYKAEYTYRSGTEKKYAAMSNLGDTTNVIGSGAQGRYYVQLGEELYNGKLTKSATYDNFDRPTTTWRYDYKKIGDYLNTPDLTYTSDVKLSAIYNDLGLAAPVVADKVDFFQNGVDEGDAEKVGAILANDGTGLATLGLSRNADNKIGANGVLTQVWYYSDKDIARITTIDTFVGKISSVSTSNDTRYVNVVDANPYVEADAAQTSNLNIPNRLFETEQFAAKDLVTYTAAYIPEANRYEIQAVNALELTTTGLLTRWEGSKNINNSTSDPTGRSGANFTAGGTTYKYSKNYRVADENGSPFDVFKFSVNKSDVNVYLDKYGYAIYVSGTETNKNYAAVIGVGLTNQYGSETRGVTLLLPDGTQQEVIAKLADGAKWGDVMTGISVRADGVTTDLTKIDVTPVAGSTAGKNLVNDGVADLVTYSVGDDGIYTLTMVKSQGYKNNGTQKIVDALGQPLTWQTGEYTWDAASAKAEFTNGKSEIKFQTRFADVYDVADDTTAYYTQNYNGQYYTTSETIFMVATDKAGGGINYNVYTGYANAPTFAKSGTPSDFYLGNVKGITFAMDSYYTNQIDVIYIYAGNMYGVSGVDTYFVKSASANVITDNDGTAYYELPAVVGGEITTIRIQSNMLRDWRATGTPVRLDSGISGVFGIENVIRNSRDIITSCDLVAFNIARGNDLATGQTGTVAANEIVVGIGPRKGTNGDVLVGTASYYAYNDNSKVFHISNDWKTVTSAEVPSVVTDGNDQVWANWDSNTKILREMFIHEMPDQSNVTYTVNTSDGLKFSTALDGAYTDELASVSSGTRVYVRAADPAYKPAASTGRAEGYNAAGYFVYSFEMPAYNIAANTFGRVSCGFAIDTVTMAKSGQDATFGATVDADNALKKAMDAVSGYTPAGAASLTGKVTYKWKAEVYSTGTWFVETDEAAGTPTEPAAGTVAHHNATGDNEPVQIRVTVNAYIDGKLVATKTSDNYSFSLDA